VGVLKPSLLLLIGPALISAAVAAAAYAFVTVYYRLNANDGQAAVQFRNPFGFWSVLMLALSVGVLIVVGRLIYEWLGVAGAIGGAAAMGLFDVDAMTVSMTRLVPSALAPEAAVVAILTGVATNTLTKTAMAAVVGRGPFALEVAGVSIACIVAGAAAAAITLAVLSS